jgi:serine protein kinase
MDSPEKWLEKWSQSSKKNFEKNHRIKSFGEYLKDLRTTPYSLTRNAVQYVVDMIEFFGEEKVYSMGELLRRFKLFSLPLPRTAIPPLVGNEEAVLDLYSALKNFVTEGRVDRIIHLHGPSGSGKSLIADWLMKGCEEYSRKGEGALYTFRWVFPAEEGKRMGFGEAPSDEGLLPTYAYLSGDDVSFRLACDLNDSPLLLIPPKRRLLFLEELLKEADEAERNKFIPTKHILEDDLCPRCREVFDALHDEYGGDVEKIIRHIQVKRLHISRRYQKGAAVISPQETPDATSRLLSTDSNLDAIPSALQYLTMEQLGGNLVNANNGIVEFSDCLSRSPELNKYLLSAVDRGSVEVSRSLVSLNLVPLASSNEENLDSFKQSPDFPPFKGVTIFIPVPYILERSKEQRIYIDTLTKIGKFKHIAPYLAEEAGLWSILTRLHKPESENYPKEIRDIVSKVGPYEKTCLYDSFSLLVPELCNFDLETVEVLSSLREEFKGTQFYEGRFGVSPREMAEIFYNEAYNRETGCIGIFDFLEGLNSLFKDQSLLKFLQLKPENGYHDPVAFQSLVKKEYLELFENDVLAAMKIYPEGGTLGVVDAYFNSVMENREDDKTRECEKLLAGERNQKKYHAEIASSIEKGLKRSEWGFIPKFIEEAKNIEARLKKGNENNISSVLHNSLDLLAGGEKSVKADCLGKSKKFVETMMENFGYCPHCLYENIKVMLDEKYS